MSFNAIRENKILAKISGFTVDPYFVDADSKGSGESAHLQGLLEP